MFFVVFFKKMPETNFFMVARMGYHICPKGKGLMDELRVTQRGVAFVLEEDDQNGFCMFAIASQ